MKFSALRLITGLTVRTRIVVLAAIPLVGFLANGTAFTTGQAEVEDAFASVKHATTLAETSQDLKAALGGMRIVVRDFAAQPSVAMVETFEDMPPRRRSTACCASRAAPTRACARKSRGCASASPTSRAASST